MRIFSPIKKFLNKHSWIKREVKAPLIHVPDSPPSPPAWGSDNELAHITIACYGIQFHKQLDPDALQTFRDWLSHLTATERSQSPQRCEYAEYTDNQGCYTWMMIAYWPDDKSHKLWSNTAFFSQYWEAEARNQGHCGHFREVITLPADRFENIFSSEYHQSGSASVGRCPFKKKLIAAHGYWGSMRQRLQCAKSDPLNAQPLSPETPITGTLGRRIKLRPPQNCAVIRSGQNLTHLGKDEQHRYQQEIEPYLVEGMAYLGNPANHSGCYSCRLMTETNALGQRTDKTFGLAYFVSLGHLEAWAREHPTHQRIFKAFFNYANDLGPGMKLRLWHEVGVLAADNPAFEYINCHPDTGLLAQATASFPIQQHCT